MNTVCFYVDDYAEKLASERAISLCGRELHQRCIETNVARIQRGERLHHIGRQARELGKLLRTWLAIQLLAQNLGCFDDAREIGRAIEWNTHGTTLTREGREIFFFQAEDGIRD